MTSMIVKELKQQFSNDLLYIYLQKAGFKEEELFPSFLDRVSIEGVYSTLEIVEMFKVNDNNLRYQMKVMRKAGYIDSILAGRNYRFNYLNIYRMYLVVLILSLPGRNTRDVLNILKEKQPEAVEKGTTKITGENSVKNEMAKTIDTSRNELEIEILNKQILINELQMNINELYKSFLQLDHRFNLSVLESGIVAKVYEILKHANKKWFLRSYEPEFFPANVELPNQLRAVKDEINTLQLELKENEKSLAIERHELQNLLENKRQLLKM